MAKVEIKSLTLKDTKLIKALSPAVDVDKYGVRYVTMCGEKWFSVRDLIADPRTTVLVGTRCKSTVIPMVLGLFWGNNNNNGHLPLGEIVRVKVGTTTFISAAGIAHLINRNYLNGNLGTAEVCFLEHYFDVKLDISKEDQLKRDALKEKINARRLKKLGDIQEFLVKKELEEDERKERMEALKGVLDDASGKVAKEITYASDSNQYD